MKGLQSERQEDDLIQRSPDSPAKGKELLDSPISFGDLDSGRER